MPAYISKCVFILIMGAFAIVAISYLFMVWFHHKLVHNMNTARGQRIMCDLCNRDTTVFCSCKAKALSLPGVLDIASDCPEPKTMSPDDDWISADLLGQEMSVNVSQSRAKEKAQLKSQ